MKKTILLAIAAVISLASMAQAKKDSSYVQMSTKGPLLFENWKPSKVLATAKLDNDTLFIEKAGAIVFDSFRISLDSLRHLLTKKPDTAYVPVYLVDVTDTIPVTYIYGDKNLKRGTGYLLIRGFKTQTAKGLRWATEPRHAGVLDDRKRPVSDVVIGTITPKEQKPASPPKQ